MSCILRASGSNFDVDCFLSQNLFKIDSLWRKGDKKFPQLASSKINQTSGIRILVSDADFSQLKTQIEDATVFLSKNLESIKNLVCYSGIEHVVLDFGAEISPPGWASFTFPVKILTLAGEAGLPLCMSVYPIDNDEKTDA